MVGQAPHRVTVPQRDSTSDHVGPHRTISDRYDGGVPGSLLRIGALATLTGTSADSIRHYERLGLLPLAVRTDGGYRMYPPAAEDRVRLIRGAVRAGFSLSDLGAFLDQRDIGGTPCRKVRAAADVILQGIDRQISELQETRENLEAMLRDWDARLAMAGDQPARLLDALPRTRKRPERQTTHLKRSRRKNPRS